MSGSMSTDELNAYLLAQHETAHQEELKRQQELLQVRERAIAASGNSIVISDVRLPDMPIVYVNRAFVQMTGYATSEVLGRNCRFLQGADNNQPELVTLRTAMAKGKACTVVLRNYRKNGTLFWNELNISPIFDADNKLTHFVGIQNDVTERKQAEEEVQHALAKEKELNDLKSRFVAMTSHEFRTPLTLILTSAELLEQLGNNWTGDLRREHLDRIKMAVRQMVDLLEDVISFSKVDNDNLQPNLTTCELVQFCRELITQTQLMAGTHHTIKFATPAQELWARVDRKLLYQAISNLLANALKYSPNGGTIELELHSNDNKIVILVRDEGIGIPPADQPHIFEMFHRAANVGNIKGTGLGLAIVKKIVELHAGQIRFVSRIGVGTVFSITLPAAHRVTPAI